MTGLRGANAASQGAISGGGGGSSSSGGSGSSSTDIVNTDANSGGNDVELRRGGSVGGMGTMKNLSAGAAAGSALDRALSQLAALGGENVSSRLNVSRPA